MAAPNEKVPSVKLEPVKINGDTLTTTNADNRPITDKEYHAQRNAVNGMRSSNPLAARLYDRFLGSIDDPKKFPGLQADEMKSLQDSAGRHKVQFGSVGNAVGLEMRANKYDTNFRPSVMVEVNGRKMASDVVANHLKASGVEGRIEIPRSEAPGKISGEISFAKSEAVKLVPAAKDNASWRMIKEELMATAGTSPAREAAKTAQAAKEAEIATKSAIDNAKSGIGAEAKAIAAETKGLGSKLPGVLKAAGPVVGLVGAGVAEAHEPGATPKTVAVASANGAINSFPGVENYRKGEYCKAFGEVAGVTAQGGMYVAGAAVTTAAVAGGTVTTGVGGVALGAGMAVLTVKAGESANQLGTAAGQATCETILEGGIMLRQKAGQFVDNLLGTTKEPVRETTMTAPKSIALGLTS